MTWLSAASAAPRNEDGAGCWWSFARDFRLLRLRACTDCSRQNPPLSPRQQADVAVAGSEDLDADVIGAGRMVLGDALHHRVSITPRAKAIYIIPTRKRTPGTPTLFHPAVFAG